MRSKLKGLLYLLLAVLLGLQSQSIGVGQT